MKEGKILETLEMEQAPGHYFSKGTQHICNEVNHRQFCGGKRQILKLCEIKIC